MPTIESERIAPSQSSNSTADIGLPGAAVLEGADGPSRERRPSVLRRVIEALRVLSAADRRRPRL